jgi:glycosyltransferase involved in cell wall biosynthesis
MPAKKVSIIMSTYNNSEFIRDAIDSILNQTYGNIELIVSDDGSTDNTREIIDSYTDSRIKRFHQEKNQGILRQENMLMNQTDGYYIGKCDGDDICEPTKIEKQVRAFEENPNLAVCWVGVNIIDEHNNIIARAKTNEPLTDQDIRNHIRQKRGIPCPNVACMLFRKEYIVKHGGYKQIFDQIGSWDIDLALRLIESGEVAMINEPLFNWRRHSSSFSRKVNYNGLRNQSHKIAFFLRDQRLANNGLDDTTGLASGQLEEFIVSLKSEYEKDPSKIYREICKSRDLAKSIRREHGFIALRKNPFNVNNYKYLLRVLF